MNPATNLMARIAAMIFAWFFRQATWCVLSCLMLHMLWADPSSAQEASDLPHIVLLMGDDHGWDETGYNKHPHLQTPVLDEMAKTALRLDHFYSAHPSCSPTRGSVLTGRHPNRYGTFSPGYSIRPEEKTIAHLLKEAGYRCGHFGKWHLGPVKSASPTNPGRMGFDHWISHDNFFELDPVLSRDGGPPTKYLGESSEIVVRHAIEFLEKEALQSGKPTFTVIWYGSPHEPYSGLDKDLQLYDNLPEEYAEKSVSLTSNETGKKTKRPLRDVLRERYAEITAMDRSIGELRDWLREQGLANNTLLWYCGDNGSPTGAIETSPLRGQKGQVYEGGIRVPGLIEWPARIRAPFHSSMRSVTSDILPTICEVAGVAPPRRPLDGVSLLPLITGQPQQRDAPIFFWDFANRSGPGRTPYIEPELQKGTTPLVKMMAGLFTRNFKNDRFSSVGEKDYAGSRVMLTQQYKLVQPRSGAPELYDLAADPYENDNIAAAQHQIVTLMQRDLRSWQTSVLSSLLGEDY